MAASRNGAFFPAPLAAVSERLGENRVRTLRAVGAADPDSLVHRLVHHA